MIVALVDVETIVTRLDVDEETKVVPDDVVLIVAVDEAIDELEVDIIDDDMLNVAEVDFADVLVAGADDELIEVEVKLLKVAGAILELATELVVSVKDVIGARAEDELLELEDVIAVRTDGELVEVKLLEVAGAMLELATELVVSVEAVIGARAVDELLKVDEVDAGVTKLEFAPKPVIRDENVDDTVELTALVLVGILKVFKYDEVLTVEAEDRIDELVVETFMLGVAARVIVKSDVVFVARNKTDLEADEVFAKAEVVAIELVMAVPLITELEVTGAIELA